MMLFAFLMQMDLSENAFVSLAILLRFFQGFHSGFILAIQFSLISKVLSEEDKAMSGHSTRWLPDWV